MNSSARIVIWCGDAPNQRALAHKLSAAGKIAGIVIDKKRKAKRPPVWKKLPAAILDRTLFRSISRSWSSLQARYDRQYPGWPDAEKIEVDSINSDAAFLFTQSKQPDLVIVSGTGLVKSKMLSLRPSIGIINLHTGLSPYIKGGPNCTNWCIATGQFEKIGNTIMWINEGIDAGNIITTEITPLGQVRDLANVHWQVMEHAHALYLRAVHYLLHAAAPYQSVPQKQVAEGTLFLTRMWNFTAKRKFLANLPRFLESGGATAGKEIVTVPLPSIH